MLAEINAIIARSQSFLLTTHESPDGDAIGSTLALACYLSRLGKKVAIHCCDPVPDVYAFLPLAERVSREIPDRRYDVCFVLDVGELRRAGKAVADCRTIDMFINIDHHLTREEFGKINFIDSDACATGALVYRLIKAAGDSIDYDTALCIYTSVITDTGSFRYSNANTEAFSIAGEMISCGVNAWYVAERLYESQPRKRLELLALSLATLRISPRGDYASLAVTLDMYERTGGCAELTDGFVNYPRSIRGVEVALFFREITPGLFKVGFRSKGKVDVSSLAAAFGGGGHHNAAGCTATGTLDEVRTLMSGHLEKYL